MATLTVEAKKLGLLLEKLLNRDVTAVDTDKVDAAPEATYGLVDDKNNLVAVIGADLAFAQRSGAALAMIPAGGIPAEGEPPDPDLIEIYHEVINVISRLINEAQHRATLGRLRLDPDLTHDAAELAGAVNSGEPVVVAECDISGYGPGKVGVWSI